MTTETTDHATGWATPRGLAFLAARNAVIDECKQRKAEIDRECTERLIALRDEFTSGADHPGGEPGTVPGAADKQRSWR